MSFPAYQTLNLRSSDLEDLKIVFNPDLNLKRPVVINLKTLDIDQQREVIGLIEHFFTSHNVSYKFPYPIYLITDHEASITSMPTVFSQEELPRFFTQKETKMNVKETHLIGKNKLLQQELKNTDARVNREQLELFGLSHRNIFEFEEERLFYRSIINRLSKVKNNG